MNDKTTGYKILTSDFRPPIQGGEPLFNDIYPHTLPTVALDTSNEECAAGWNYTATLAGAIKIAGLWRTGRPNAMMLVEPTSDWIERGNKRRASGLTLVRAATDIEIQSAILEFSAAFGTHAIVMAEGQWLWYQALGRPQRNRDSVIAGLQSALSARGLEWSLKEFPSESAARDAWDARAARDARAAWDAWDARDAWDAWDAWAAWDARAARDARAAWDARAARDARDAWDAWDALDARDARDAWAALIVQFAARSGWISHKSDLLTVGIRDAYLNGLDVALPTGPNELGWSMAK